MFEEYKSLLEKREEVKSPPKSKKNLIKYFKVTNTKKKK